MPHGMPLPSAILDLARDDQAVGLGEEAPVRGAHDQRRHQVLEHRARPGDQRRAAGDVGGDASHPEPVLGRNVALGDREEAREPRFGGEKVVAVRVALAVARQVADRQELALARRAGSGSPSTSRGRGRSAAMPVEALGEQRRAVSEASVAGVAVEHRGCIAAATSSARRMASLRRTSPDAVPRRRALSASGWSVARRAAAASAAAPVADGFRHRARLARLASRLSTRRPRPDRREQADMVGHPADDALAGRRLADCLLAGIGEGDEVAREVAAVDGRDVLRIERPEVGRVVPVVEVAAEPVHPAHRAERRVEPLDHVVEADPAEVAGATRPRAGRGRYWSATSGGRSRPRGGSW